MKESIDFVDTPRRWGNVRYSLLGYIIVCIIGCIACSRELPKETKEALPLSDSISTTTTIKIDTVYAQLPLEEPIDSHNMYYQPHNNSKELRAFLQEPIDLPKFKKKNGANSGSSKGAYYYWKPKGKGFYYHYFLFRGCYERRLMIDVYMYGDSPSSYSKAKETLIELRCSCQLDGLEALDLVGKEWSVVVEKYGENYLKTGNKIIYADKGNLLIITCRGKRVHSYRYVRTNLKAIESLEDVPEELLAPMHG